MRHALHLALSALLLAAPALAVPTLEYLDSGQWTFNEDVAVQGTRVATSLSYGVQLWEVGDPASPALLGDYYMDGHRGRAIAWEGNLVVASTKGTDWLYLLDVSDPTHPARIDRLQGVGNSADIALVRDGAARWCYTAGGTSLDFQIRDLAVPAASVLRGSLGLAGTANSLAVIGDHAYVCADAVGLLTIDVSDPDAPQLVDTETVSGTHIGIAADGTRAALASGDGGFTLFDISNPANPVRHATVSPAAGSWSDLEVREVLIAGTTLYAICWDVGALAYDISDLDAPQLTGYDPRLDISPPSPPYYAFYEGVVTGGRLYLCEWNGYTPGCIVLDAASGTMDYLGRTLGFDYVRDVDEDNGFVYGCTGQMGIFAHEHRSQHELVPRGQLHVVESWGVQAHGSLVYVASTTDGLVVGDFSDPDKPLRRGELDLGQARQLTVQGGVAYVAAYTQGFRTVDVTNPDHLVELDAVTRPNMRSLNIDKVGSLVVTSDQADGMNLWNVADPANIQHIANWPTSGQTLDVVLSPDGKYAYLVVAGTGVQVLDVDPPTSPALLTTIASGASGVVLEDGYLHVTTGTGGVRSYHQAASPTAPTLLASFDTTHEAKGICARTSGGAHTLYVADTSAILVLALNLDTPVAVSNFALAWTGSAVQVDWLLGEPVAAADLRLTAAPASGGAAAEIPFAPLGAGGQAWQALDARAELAGGGEWRYTLEGREPGGDWALLRSETIETGGAPPAASALRAWPNPFNPSTRLDFTLPAAGPARLAVYDVAGRELALLHEGPLPAGPAGFAWDGRDAEGRALPSGVYLARLSLPGAQRQAKLVMLR